MSDKTGVKLNVLTVLVAVMLVALVAQSVAIHRLSGHHDNASSLKEISEMKSEDSHGKVSVPKSHLQNKDDKLLDDPWFNLNINDWDPFKEMHSMHDRINHMFGNAFDRFEQSDHFKDLFKEFSFSPDMNMEEEKDKYIITMDMPGIDDSQIDIKLDGQALSVSGEINKSTEKEDKGTIIMKERHSGSFKRSITLPGPVKADEMTSFTKNGVLHIEIPKDSGTK